MSFSFAPIMVLAQPDFNRLEKKVDSLKQRVDSLYGILNKRAVKFDYKNAEKLKLDSALNNLISINVDTACYKMEYGKITPVIIITVTNKQEQDYNSYLNISLTLINESTREALGTLNSVICRPDQPLISNTKKKFRISNSFTIGLPISTNLPTLNITAKAYLNDTYFWKQFNITDYLLNK